MHIQQRYRYTRSEIYYQMIIHLIHIVVKSPWTHTASQMKKYNKYLADITGWIIYDTRVSNFTVYKLFFYYKLLP